MYKRRTLRDNNVKSDLYARVKDNGIIKLMREKRDKIFFFFLF